MKPDMRRRGSRYNGSTKSKSGISAESSPLQKVKTEVLLLFHELPDWAKDNEFIHSGFRPETNSYWKSLKSMGYIHNETGNIYTHFFAALWMFILGSWWSGYAKERYPITTFDDTIVFFLFFLGGAICFLLSTAYHVFSNHSHATHLFCLKLDFLGILVVTAGCFPPGLWYTFPCAPRQTKFTWIAVSNTYGYFYLFWEVESNSQFDLAAQFCAALLVLFSKTFQSSKMRAFRGFVFSVMASSAFYPIIIKIFQVGWTQANAEYGASLYGLTIIIYLCSMRVTEAWKPGYFDIWGHSHQIFHVGMAIGLTVHFLAFFRAVDQFYAVKHGYCPD
ncbi:hypothetical protein HYALB_00003168 [Hymenoscyphus albidus]|uniref:Uncharacterized protein n=1 Tax=Hymenoscyphus albidus TaxID=595503 RepID=A0A9N9PXG1_9HELO|nr:hypothetical protein HYALB_00003168 [Hymenoscyphus albidus]